MLKNFAILLPMVQTVKLELIKNRIEYVKITLQDEQYFESKRYNITDHITDFDFNVGDKIHIKTPQKVVLGYITEEALYYNNVNLLATEYNDPMMSFLIETPKEVIRQQNREFFRVRSDNKVRIVFTDEEGSEKYVTCKLYDISAGGIRVILNKKDEKVPENAELEIAFRDKLIKCKSKLMRMQNVYHDVHAAYRFENTTGKVIDYIVGFCIKKQAKTKKVIG